MIYAAIDLGSVNAAIAVFNDATQFAPYTGLNEPGVIDWFASYA
jgi:hypothetical protein